MEFITRVRIVTIVASIIPIIIIIAARAVIIPIVIPRAIGCYRSAKGETHNPRTERNASVIVVMVPAVAVAPGRAMMPTSIATAKPIKAITWPSFRRRGR